MDFKTYLILIDAFNNLSPGDYWLREVLDAIYNREPHWIVEWRIKNYAARIYRRNLFDPRAKAYNVALRIAIQGKDRELIRYLITRMKELRIPFIKHRLLIGIKLF